MISAWRFANFAKTVSLIIEHICQLMTCESSFSLEVIILNRIKCYVIKATIRRE